MILGTLSADLATCSLALARRLHAGGTLWCVAPEWPQHAQHVAVEFVHPVIVGKRALPAVAVIGPDPTPALRALVAPGDVILALGPGGVGPVLQRAAAWGAATVWIGTGERPAPGAADHVLWLGQNTDEPFSDAIFTGEIVLLYHLLWELTHVCFEHPGLLSPGAEADACVTCGDVAHVAEVVREHVATTTVRTACGSEEIDTSLVGTVAPGDLLLIHAGTAIERVEVG